MKTFFESSATKAILIYLALQLLMTLQPMLDPGEEIDGRALVKALVGAGIVLLGNALRPDVRTGIKALDARNNKP
jgi:hypothetical protein